MRQTSSGRQTDSQTEKLTNACRNRDRNFIFASRRGLCSLRDFDYRYVKTGALMIGVLEPHGTSDASGVVGDRRIGT